MSKQNKTVKIRLISPFYNQLSCANTHILQQYYDYLYSLNRIQVIARCLEPLNFNQHNNQSFSSDQSISNEPNSELEDILSFLESKKVNIYKNILLGFRNHILTCKDIKMIQFYESLSYDQWTFDHIQKRIKESFKNLRRFSLKFKNFITSKNLQNIFISYLQNSDKLWLQSSKIKNKDTYKKYIDLILKAYESKLLVNKIVYYKKSRQQH